MMLSVTFGFEKFNLSLTFCNNVTGVSEGTVALVIWGKVSKLGKWTSVILKTAGSVGSHIKTRAFQLNLSSTVIKILLLEKCRNFGWQGSYVTVLLRVIPEKLSLTSAKLIGVRGDSCHCRNSERPGNGVPFSWGTVVRYEECPPVTWVTFYDIIAHIEHWISSV